jgi:tripartite-type tricarboxylate transporter receptor subunit TctC
MKRLKFLTRTIGIATLACVAASLVEAQPYPSKPVRVLIASSAGSNPDTLTRIIASGLTSALGQQVIVDNRAGAGGNIGAEVAARAPADGYTVFMAHTNHTINASLYRKLNYDLLADFAPVSLMAVSSFVAAVHPSLPVRSIPDLIRLAKARPGDILYASAGTGSGTYFTAEYFNALAGVKMLHVAYNGGGPALTAAISGEAAVYFSPIATGLPHIRNGRLRALGVAMPRRAEELPDVPAIADTLPGFEMYSWAGMFVPAKTPQAVVGTLHKAGLVALANAEAAKRLKEAGFIAIGSTPEELTAHCRREIDKYAKIIRSVGLPQQ